MPPQKVKNKRSIATGSGWVRPVRLFSGLVMLTFVLTHFANHALGLISLSTMEASRLWLMAPWRHPVGNAVMLTAVLVHLMLGLWAIYQRRTLRMPTWEALQIAFGLLVAPLLLFHVFGVMQARETFRADALYTLMLAYFWTLDPAAGWRQFVLFVAVWIHACIGIHFWLRFRGAYQRWFPVILSTALLIPVLALLGLTQAAREVVPLSNQPGFTDSLRMSSPGTTASAYDTNGTQESAGTNDEIRRDLALAALVLLLSLVLLARAVRQRRTTKASDITVHYLNGPDVKIPRGWTILEASRAHGIPHTSVCGGRARCSTCRIRVSGNLKQQPAATRMEQRLLDRIGAAANVRLACQMRPHGDITVAPLLTAVKKTESVQRQETGQRETHSGEEREVTVLFADLRGFTRLAEQKLPYDVVFLLNKYFEAAGGAIQQAGGIANQFTGDGVMALFGVQTDPAIGCRQALKAAGEMVARVEALSNELGNELPAPLRIGIGIHLGSAVVGEMGYESTRYLTAVGDTTNTASRLESMTKEFECELVVSKYALETAGLSANAYPMRQVEIRNREQTLDVLVVASARDLANTVREPTTS